MDLEQEVHENEWNTDELVEHHFVGPEDRGTTEIVIPPEWYDDWTELDGTYEFEWSEEAPDGIVVAGLERDDEEFTANNLVFRHRGHRISIENDGFAKWKFQVDVPLEVSKWFTGPHGADFYLKSRFHPGVGDEKTGYIDEVHHHPDGSKTLHGYINENYQPMVALRSMVDDLTEHAEESERAAAELESAFKAAKKNAD